jgi:L-arabinokinase
MGHRIILEKIREMGAAAGMTMTADPTNGYLANVEPDDYKALFRSHVPEVMMGREFLDRYGPTADGVTRVEADVEYQPRHATDHHVLEPRRVRRFVEFLEAAGKLLPGVRDLPAGKGIQSQPPPYPPPAYREREKRWPPNLSHTLPPGQRKLDLDRAGHLMYASHQSYGMDAMLGAAECDVLVDLVRRNEAEGLYGGRITGGGSGGTVAVLADVSERADAAIDRIMDEYESRTGKKPEAFRGSSAGACYTGSVLS